MLLENDAETHASVAQIISATPSYSRQEREKIIKSNSKIVNHPYYFRYTPLQRLCLRILRHEKLSTEQKRIKYMEFCLMYLIYGKSILPLCLQSKDSNTLIINKELDEYIWQNKFPRYPDFYREEDCYIIDAKYKREISRDDIHQMITYMYRLKGKNGLFIQPSDKIWQKRVMTY